MIHSSLNPFGPLQKHCFLRNLRHGAQKNCKKYSLEFVGNHFCSHICNPIQNGMDQCNAQMAELVDALVSNTNEVTLVPVRLRLWVQRLAVMQAFFFIFYF